MDSTKPPLRIWFPAVFLISQYKTGLSSLALMRQLGTSYRTAWLIYHRLMSAMWQQDGEQPLSGIVQVDGAYLEGEHPGVPGRGLPNKVPIVAAVQTHGDGHPLRVKLLPVAGFTQDAILNKWARTNLTPGTDVCSDGLSCFAAAIDAGCAHSDIVVGSLRPRDPPQFTWVNTFLGNLKTMINGRHKAFKFGKYASQHLGAFGYRFSAGFDLRALLHRLIGRAATGTPTHERKIRGTTQAEVHD